MRLVAVSLTIYQKRKLKKSNSLEKLKQDLSLYKGFLVVGITGVETPVLQTARKKLKDLGRVRVFKNVILSKALDSTGLGDTSKSEIKKALEGENALLLTNQSVFAVASILNKLKKKSFVKPNRVAPLDIIIPQGVTTLQPGPMTDSLTALGVPFEIKKNLVYVKKDSVVVKRGEVVNNRVADLLRALDIAPVDSGFVFKAAFEDGLLIPGDRLELDFETYRSNVFQAYQSALALSVNSALPVAESLPFVLAKAASEALSVSIESKYVTAESAPLLFGEVVSTANYIAAEVKKKKPEYQG
jgi:large subunit ribosomal protein L10